MPLRLITDGPALVVAPHPDDETFGCGGLIALKRERNVNVRVAFLTSGEGSLRSFPGVDLEAVGRIRRQQAIEMSADLGLNAKDLIWLGLPDQSIPRRSEQGFVEAVRILMNEMERIRAREIYCPHPFDGLLDHEAASDITLEAVRQCGLPVRLSYYVVWAWFNAPWGAKGLNLSKGWRLDIRNVMEKKSRALSRYLNHETAPCGVPYCGKLPRSLIHCARVKDEIFF
jgi:LmbE family N-acetylglucosaminyl deacetylase